MSDGRAPRGTSAPEETALRARIRRILKAHGRLHYDADHLSEHDDLYEAGLSAQASVNVMLALEHEFQLEFPDQMLSRSVFYSIGNLASAIAQIHAG